MGRGRGSTFFFKKGSFPELGVVCKLPKWQTGSKAQKASSLAGDFRYLKMAQKVSVCRRNAYSWQGPEYLDVSFLFSLILSLGHTRKFIPPPWYKRVGGGRDGTRGDWWNPSLEFLMLQYFETTLPSMESLWSSQQDEVHFKGQLVLLGPCDVTNSARQLGRHLGFYK